MRWLLMKTLRILAQGSRADARERAVLIRQIRAALDQEVDEEKDDTDVGF